MAAVLRRGAAPRHAASAGYAACLHAITRELQQHLDASRRELLAAVAAVPAADHDRRPHTGGWSVANVLAHLARTEGQIAAFLARALRDAEATAPLPPAPAAAGPVLATLDAARLLDRTTRLDAPVFAAPDPDTTAAAATTALERARARLCEVLHAADGRDTAALRRAHHVLGELTFAQWIAFAGYHERRHAAQIRELGATLAAG